MWQLANWKIHVCMEHPVYLRLFKTEESDVKWPNATVRENNGLFSRSWIKDPNAGLNTSEFRDKRSSGDLKRGKSCAVKSAFVSVFVPNLKLSNIGGLQSITWDSDNKGFVGHVGGKQNHKQNKQCWFKWGTGFHIETLRLTINKYCSISFTMCIN